MIEETVTNPWEMAYWVSQIFAAGFQLLLLLAAIGAGAIAYYQLDTFKLFEWLRFLQDERFREARRVVIREISVVRDTTWWQDDRLEAAGALCCANYDILGRMLRFRGSRRLANFFITNWGDSIVRTYLVLKPFILHRRAAGGYDSEGYAWLFARARIQFPNIDRGQPIAN
jgi:hypothetical protein